MDEALQLEASRVQVGIHMVGQFVAAAQFCGGPERAVSVYGGRAYTAGACRVPAELPQAATKCHPWYANIHHV